MERTGWALLLRLIRLGDVLQVREMWARHQEARRANSGKKESGLHLFLSPMRYEASERSRASTGTLHVCTTEKKKTPQKINNEAEVQRTKPSVRLIYGP